MATQSSRKSPSKSSKQLSESTSIIEANGVKYLITETYGKTRSGKSIRSCKWETYTEEMKLF